MKAATTPTSTPPVGTGRGYKLLSAMSSFRNEAFWITLASVAINLLALASPLVMLQVFDRILAKGSMETLALIMGGATVAILLESLLRVLRSRLSAWGAAQFEHRAMMALTSRLLAMPVPRFERSGTGAHQDHFKAVQSLKSYYSGQTFQQVIDLPFVALYIGVIALINSSIGLLLVGGYLLFGLLTWLQGLHHRQRIIDRNQADLRRGNFLSETLGNIHTLKSMSMEALMLRRYERLQESGARAMSALARTLDMASGIGTLFSPLMTMLTVAMGAYFVIRGELTTGELAACTMLGFRALAPIQRLGGIWARHRQDSVTRADLARVMDEPALGSGEPLASVPGAPPGLSMQGVSYQFPGSDQKLLDQANLYIAPGEFVLIHGANGSGRSTLLHLLCGVLRPTEGQVCLDGQDMVRLDSDAVQRRIAYLPQRTQIFEGTLLENVTVFDLQRTDAALDLARTLRVDSIVAKMPRGWDTQVGDSSVEAMPPGHRQRIAIVRSLSGSPDILLFDDATTAVDAAGEALIINHLKSLKGRCTLVIVSQRPSLQRLADRAVTLTDGKLIEVTLPLPHGQAGASTAASVQPMSAAEVATSDPWQRAHSTVMSNFREPSDLAACVPPMLKALGWRRSSREMAETLPYFTDALDLPGLENALAQLGYGSTKAHCRLADLDRRSTPCLFVPENGPAFVVLDHLGQRLLVADNAISPPRELDPADLKGTVCFFRKIDDMPMNTRGWVTTTLARFRPLVLQAGLSSIVSGLVLAVSSLFLMAVYSEVIPTAALDTLLYLALGVLIALLVGAFFTVLRANILAYLAGRIDYLFGSTILQKILSLSPGLTERASVGAQMARLSTFEAIRDLFTGPLAATLLELPATLVVLIVLAIINPIALLVFLVAMSVYALLYWWLEPISAQRVAEAGRASTRRNEFIVEMIGKMRTIRECGACHSWLERMRDVSANATMAAYRNELMSATLVGVSYGVMMLAGLAIVTFTVPATLNQTLGPGVLIASMTLMWRVLGPMQTAFTNLAKIERIRGAARQIEAIMRIKGERLETAASPVARGLNGKIEFARVSFRYSPTVDPALVGASFTIQPGEVIAITGPNGGGKSTVLKMLLGLYQPQAGAILVDDVDIRQIDPTELRRLIGYAPQETQFFRATLAQNLRLARPDATDEELMQALDLAGAREQVLSLPKGLEFRIGDNASEQLPASLRQKLVLARAYLTHAPIMLFDEPGTGLDDLGDSRFMDMLRSKHGQSTILFVTHRPSHMRLADRIMVFENGYLRAAGAPSEILRAPAAA